MQFNFIEILNIFFYLGGDFLVLDTLLLLLLKLSLDLLRKAIAMLGLDAIAGNVSLGLGMDALGRSSHVVLAQLVEVTAKSAELVLQHVGGEDNDAAAVESELSVVLG